MLSGFQSKFHCKELVEKNDTDGWGSYQEELGKRDILGIFLLKTCCFHSNKGPSGGWNIKERGYHRISEPAPYGVLYRKVR